jgi:hypothetical protein
MSLEWKAIYDRILWKGNFKKYLDDLILDAPQFNEPWDRAFQHWKDYLNKKDDEGKIMKKFNDKNKKK